MGDSWEFVGPEGSVPVRLKARLKTNSCHTCRTVALRNKGIILQPNFMVQDDLESGALVEILPRYRSLELGIYAVYPTRKHVLPKVPLLIDYLTRSLEKQS